VPHGGFPVQSFISPLSFPCLGQRLFPGWTPNQCSSTAANTSVSRLPLPLPPFLPSLATRRVHIAVHFEPKRLRYELTTRASPGHPVFVANVRLLLPPPLAWRAPPPSLPSRSGLHTVMCIMRRPDPLPFLKCTHVQRAGGVYFAAPPVPWHRIHLQRPLLRLQPTPVPLSSFIHPRSSLSLPLPPIHPNSPVGTASPPRGSPCHLHQVGSISVAPR